MMGPTAARAPEEIRAWLVDAIAGAADLDPAGIDPTRSFHDFGLTSSQAVAMSGQLEEWLDRPLEPTLLYEHPNIDALAAALGGGEAPANVSVREAAPDADAAADADVVCIVGVGCRFPGGADGPEQFWQNLLAGADGGREVPPDRWDAAAHFDANPGTPGKAYTTRGGFLEDVAGFDAAFFGISPAEALRMDPQQRMLLEVSWAALEDAGIAADRLRGSRTGVFVGMMTSQEYGRLELDSDGDRVLDDPYFGYGTAPSVAAGRLSYAMDLRGPSLCVDTACSSSLLSVHLAAESLRRGECELALAGGVSALVHPAAMVQACAAHMLARDGRCKPFDERADGFLMAEGCGFVVLERLGDALARGHRVLAVLRGSAVNQDGRSNGMTAPSPEAQAGVIRRALAAAGVAPADVGYVEAHGSGTRLGDAIELSALQDVFRDGRDPSRPLVVGAVKGNLGHLLGAAGVAGLVKALHVLRDGRVPPNRNLEQPSSAIDWSRAPVLVPRETVALEGPAARLAGVSSFGWSGTNVHVVLERWAPDRAAAGDEARAQVVPVSARTETALRRAAAAVAEHLDGVAAGALAGVAHTLQSGRAAHEHRAAFVCHDPADAAAALRNLAEGGGGVQVRPGTSLRPVFLFPGTGDQRRGMGADLYAGEPAFRAALDACAHAAAPVLGADLADVLYAGGERAACTAGDDLAARLGRGAGAAPPEGEGPLERTDVAHCAVFAIEYALARLLQSWGVEPAGMVGYSLGEYVAACVAGVFELEDAVRLVARRAQLIASLRDGAMVAVAAPAPALEDLLAGGASVAAMNGPAMTVLSGPVERMAEIEAELDRRGVAHQRIRTRHALHSGELEPIRAEVEALLAAAGPKAPAIPFVSSATGTWIEDGQACEPAYWAQQMIAPVRFDAAVAEVARMPGVALIEVGPGQTLASLARQALLGADRRDIVVTATLPAGIVAGQGGDREQVLRALAAYWTGGGEVDWKRLHGPDAGRMQRLPTYPFEHQRFWPSGRPAPATPRERPADEWLHLARWAPIAPPEAGPPSGPFLVVGDDDGPGGELAARLSARLAGHGSCVRVFAGERFAQRADGAFELRPDDAGDYELLAARLADGDGLPATVVHLWGVTGTRADGAEPDTMRGDRARGFDSVVGLARALAGAGGAAARIVAVTDDMQDVTGTESVAPGKRAGLGACLVIPQEHPGITCLSVDLAAGCDVADAVAHVEAELAGSPPGVAVAYRDGARRVASFAPAPAPAQDGPAVTLRDRGVYLLTGGLGNVGLLLAEHLARRVREPRLVLTGRRGLPPRDGWPALLEAEPESGEARRISSVLALEAAGAEVLVVAADAARPDAMARAVDAARERFGRIDGVVHGAGLTSREQFEPIQMATRATTDAHFTAKIESLLALDRALGGERPDFWVLQSSISAVLGGVGFAAYAAANAVLDAYAARRSRDGERWMSIDWDTWEPTAGEASGALGASMAQFAMPVDKALAAFDRALATPADRIVVSTGDLEQRMDQWVQRAKCAVRPRGVSAERFPRPQLAEAFVPPRGRLERRLAELWQDALGLERIGVNDSFFDLGGTSLIGLHLVRRVAEEYERDIPAVALFEAPTISALARYLGGDEQEDDSAVELDRRREVARRSADADAIAIIGMAGRFPGARDVAQFWRNLRDGVESVTFFDDDELLAAGVPRELLRRDDYVKARPVLDDVDRFDAGFFGYSAREAQITDPQHRVFLECCWHALEDAGYAPRSYPGDIGVFAGTNISTYLRYLHGIGALGEDVSEYETVIGNDKDALTTTVSYKFDLTGPSVAVQTFCSTSLVALHMAAMSLRAGECDIALAGGVSVRVPDRVGHLFAPGGMECPDGHVRTFDAKAGGALFGDGAGVVVLKRLSDSIADGDAVRAVVRGSAINNDGALKVGFTAPSVAGQSEVITRALAGAGVEPETISYVEAHGTGTPLGDPIEIAALTRAFGDAPARGSCPIGSVKTNVGHLDRAAGVSGLVKTVLAMEHREIPASLHFSEPNPQIDFDSSPFRVNTELTPWEPPAGTPRRAGVSSLGMGGTNVHVVLEEAPPREPSGPARAQQLLAISARSPEALDESAANLARFLRETPEADLADVAYTLQVGRETFEHRRVVRCSGAQEAIAALEGSGDGRALARREHVQERPVALVFAGVGEQYVGMAAGLYASEPAFRKVVDECAAIAEPLLGVDLRSVLFDDDDAASGEGMDLRALMGRGGDGRAAPDPLAATAIAQPTVFVVEYALARLLESWGVRPDAMAGYSLGEYVAATVAGVMTLPDALRLVAERARLIDELPSGAMLAVPLALEDVEDLCGDDLDVAAVNAPTQCVVAGPEAAIADLQERLEARGVASRRLDTTHAFHSRMLAPAADALTAFVRENIALAAPRLPYVSNVSGRPITAQEATDPSYWARHMCATVRFGEALGELLDDPDRMLVEVGPGHSLGAFARQHPACDAQRMSLIAATLPARHDPTDAAEALHTAVGRLWLAGVPIDWEAYHARGRRRRVSLPGYAFQRERYWVEPPAAGTAAGAVRALPAGAAPDPAADLGAALTSLPREDLDDWLYLPVWRQAAPPAPARQAPDGAWLILADSGGLADALVARVGDAGATAVRAVAGDGFEATADGGFVVRPGVAEDYVKLVEALRARDLHPRHIAILWALDDAPAGDDGDSAHRWALDRSYYGPLWLAQALGSVAGDDVDVVLASARAYNVTGVDAVRPESATAAGPCKVVPLEFPHMRWRQVDLDPPASARDAELIAGRVVAELSADRAESVVAWRGARRWLPDFEALPTAPAQDGGHGLRDGGVYVITGGLGGIGLAIAERLAREHAAKLVLVTRSALPPREAWPALSENGAQATRAHDRVRSVLELEAAGAEVLVCVADVTDASALRRAIGDGRERFGAVDGVIHAAGVPGMGLVQLRTTDTAGTALAPKVAGTRALRAALEGLEVDLLVLFSSITSVTGGGPGQVDYCAANAYLDAVAQGSNGSGPRVVSIDWGEWQWDAWSDGLSGYAPEVRDFFQDHRRRFGIGFDEGWQALVRALGSHQPQVIVSTQDFRRVAPLVGAFTIERVLALGRAARGRHARPELDTSFVSPGNETEEMIAGLWCDALGLEAVGVHDNFFELGGNSLMGVELVARTCRLLERDPVPPHVLYLAPTVKGLAELVTDGDRQEWVDDRRERGASRREHLRRRRTT